MEILTCLVHIDASLLNFKFTEPVYVDVKYGTEEVTKSAVVSAIEVSPSVLASINDLPAFIRICESAANHNAEQYWRYKNTGERPATNLHPVFEQALRPYTSH
jgi:hypothetical protein